MTECEAYMMSKGRVDGEQGKAPSIETSLQEPARVYETPNLQSIYEQI